MHLNRWRVKPQRFLPNSGLCAFFLLPAILDCLFSCLFALFFSSIIKGCVSNSGPLIMLS